MQYEVIECEDVFNADTTHFGEIDFKQAKIKINKDMAESIKEETLFHEITHGILVHLGYNEYNQNEQFVQALGNAMYQMFKFKEVRNE